MSTFRGWSETEQEKPWRWPGEGDDELEQDELEQDELAEDELEAQHRLARKEDKREAAHRENMNKRRKIEADDNHQEKRLELRRKSQVNLLMDQYEVLPPELLAKLPMTKKRLAQLFPGVTFTPENIGYYYTLAANGPQFPTTEGNRLRPGILDTKDKRRQVLDRVLSAADANREDAPRIIQHANTRLPLIGINPIQGLGQGGRRTRRNRKSRKKFKRNNRKSRR
jgi:hypothetical protein